MIQIKDIDINDYNYELPAERIAQYPLEERDGSRLLISRNGMLKEDRFRNIADHLPGRSLLVFNNSRVIHARLLFRKETGAGIEVLCLEPVFPAVYEKSFASCSQVTWKCIVGNLKKWKKGKLSLEFYYKGTGQTLIAEKVEPEELEPPEDDL